MAMMSVAAAAIPSRARSVLRAPDEQYIGPPFHTPPDEMADGLTGIELGDREAERLVTFATDTIDEVANSSPGCPDGDNNHFAYGENNHFVAGCEITNATIGFAGVNVSALHLHLACRKKRRFEVKIVEKTSGDLVLVDMKPLTLLPPCAQTYLRRKQAEARHHTAPTTREEQEEFDRENGLEPSPSPDVMYRPFGENPIWHV